MIHNFFSVALMYSHDSHRRLNSPDVSKDLFEMFTKWLPKLHVLNDQSIG